MSCVAELSVADIACIEHQVRSRVRGRVRDLAIRLVNNGLVLHGQAVTYYAKQIAQHAVMAVCDFPIWANEIEVP
jgi:hypothetical protein